MWGGGWGYPKQQDFLQRKFEPCPKDTASLIMTNRNNRSVGFCVFWAAEVWAFPI
jgi:hypothetical protein